jgi:hypothetical protein
VIVSHFKIAAILSILMCLMSVAHAKDDGVIVAEANKHRFFSSPINLSGEAGIFYEACNQSLHSSAFYWKGAGFGVDSTSKLQSGLCAHYRSFGGYANKRSKTEVVFQSQSRAHIEHWQHCRNFVGIADTCAESSAGEFVRFLSDLVYFGDGPDEVNVKLHALQFSFFYQQPSDRINSNGEISLLSESDTHQFLIAFHNEAINATVLDGAVSSDFADFKALELVSLVKDLKLQETVLFEGIPLSSTAIYISSIGRRVERGSPILRMGDIGKLDQPVSVIVLENFQPVMRVDLPGIQ